MWAGLLYQTRTNKPAYYAGIALAGVGVFSSMSSGPATAALVATAFIALYRYRRYWKIVVAAIILMCATVEIISNRHFYYYPTRFTFSESTAWYRGRLIDVALFEGGMSGHWLAGYGMDTEAANEASAMWAAKIGPRPTLDLVNHYLLILFEFGLIGLVPFLAVIAAAARKLVEAFGLSLSDSDKWLIWCLSASLVGMLVAFFTSCLHTGQTTSLFYIMIGLCGVMPLIISDENSCLLEKLSKGG
jgi:O-antigen ligase